jgi:hypothetical protein
MPKSLEFLEQEPGVCSIASLHNVMIVSWSSRGTAPAVEKVAQVSHRMATKSQRGFSAIHLIADQAGLPTPEARTGLVKIMSEFAPHLACVAVVVGGTGFWASAMRSFVTGMRFVSPRSFDLRLHGTTADVLKWLPAVHASRTGVELDEVSLARVLDTAWAWSSATEADDPFEQRDDSAP